MPPNLGNTMFARWYNQQMADYANRRQAVQDQRDDGRYQAEMLDSGAKRREAQAEQDRKDLEAKAQIAGQQAQALGNDLPQPEDTGMRVAVQQGAQGHTLSSLAAARAKRDADAKMAAEQAGRIDIERMRGRSRIDAARAHGPASVVNVGRDGQTAVGLTTPVQSDVQKKVLDARRRLAQLDTIDRDIAATGGDEAIGSYAATGGDAVRSVATRISPGLVPADDRAAMATRARADASLSTFNNEIISDLSGANVPPAEMERLSKSLPQTSDSPSVRQIKRTAWREYLQLIDQRGVDALVNGIRTGQIALPGESASGNAALRPSRTVNGETRFWDGSQWVAE